jgi:hypothetical protein
MYYVRGTTSDLSGPNTLDMDRAVDRLVPLEVAAARLGLLKATLLTCVERGLLCAERGAPGDYALHEEQLARLAQAIGRELAPAEQVPIRL